MKSFNLSAWAAAHRSLVTFFMRMIVVAGIADYFKLGRSEDPDFTVSRLFLVLSVAPLGLIGVVAALLMADKPLGFVALLGVLALIGMIARNSVILIDQIEQERAHGRDAWEAVIEATMHRFRPILLTAAAAILGMIPIAPTIFWGLMAYAIMGGLAVATVLTLVFLPALYVIWFRVERPQELRESEVTCPSMPLPS
jgi:multidrug efflux pump subunit AcrB